MSRIQQVLLQPFLGGAGIKGKTATTTSHSVDGQTWGNQPLDETSAQERSIDLSTFDVIYAPLCILCFFCSFLLMSKKLPRFHYSSLRHYLSHYINAENVYTTLKENDEKEIQLHTQLELGHLWFEAFGVCVLIFNLILNVDQTRIPFLILACTQMVLASISTVTDYILVKKGFIHVVRGTNSKLRFAHSSYQSLLFAIDGITAGGGLGTLPVDCYYSIFTHYAYEATGEVLDGEFAGGSGDLIIGLLIIAHAITNESLSTGKIAAFGVTSLILSCVSIFVSMIYKVLWSTRTHRRFVKPDHHHHHHSLHEIDKHDEDRFGDPLLSATESAELETIVNHHRTSREDIDSLLSPKEVEKDDREQEQQQQGQKKTKKVVEEQQEKPKVVEIVPKKPEAPPAPRTFFGALIARRRAKREEWERKEKEEREKKEKEKNKSEKVKKPSSPAAVSGEEKK